MPFVTEQCHKEFSISSALCTFSSSNPKEVLHVSKFDLSIRQVGVYNY